MTDTITHTIKGQNLVLSKHKALYWHEKKTLILADLHLGKAGHFQKAGIPIPFNIMERDLLRLSDLIYEFRPRSILILGDLFHSTYNSEWEFFKIWRQQFTDIRIDLVKGNHDILPVHLYKDMNISLFPEEVEDGPFVFTHHPREQIIEDKIIMCGHVHPAVTLRGKGLQSLRMPCFYFGASHLILPAFGEFTGMADIKPEKFDAIYVVDEEGIARVE